MKNMLLPTDFSENSWNAIRYAIAFFKKVRCNFYVLHVAPSNIVANGVSLASKDIFSKSNTFQNIGAEFEYLTKRIDRLPLNTRHRFFTITEHIFFVDSMRKCIEEKNIDYIVMGTKGASGFKGGAIGSNTGDVITKVKCPVLVIPEDATYVRPKETAFPTDFNSCFKKRVLSTLTEIVGLHNSALRMVHIKVKDQELTALQQKNTEFLAEYLTDTIDHSFHFLSNLDIEDAVQCFVESGDIDMITMVAKNLNFFQRILFHPTIEKISYHTKIPFLVLHE